MHAYKKDGELFLEGVDFKRIARKIAKLNPSDEENSSLSKLSNDDLNLTAQIFGYRNYQHFLKDSDRPLSARNIPYSQMSAHLRSECDLHDVKRLAVEPLGTTFRDQYLPKAFGKEWQIRVMGLLHKALDEVRGKPGHLVMVVGKSKVGKTIALKHLTATAKGLITDASFDGYPLYSQLQYDAKRKLSLKPEIFVFDGGRSHAEARVEFNKFRGLEKFFGQGSVPEPLDKDGNPVFFTYGGIKGRAQSFGGLSGQPVESPWTHNDDGMIRILSVSSHEEAFHSITGPSMSLGVKANPFPIDAAVIVDMDQMKITQKSPPLRGTPEFEAVMKRYFRQ